MGFDQLNHDCICNILEWVDDVSPQTTRDSVRFVNKEFYATTKVVGHRRKTLRFHDLRFYTDDSHLNSADRDISSWLANDQVLRGLHYLTIASDRGFQEHVEEAEPEKVPATERRKFENLVSLLSKLGNLKLLNWSYRGPIPLTVLEALHKYHPKAELRVYNFSRMDDTTDHQDAAELALSKSPALTVLRASIWGINNGTNLDLREAAFKRIAANAPNLRFASVITGQSGSDVYILSDEEQEELDELTASFITHDRPNDAVRSLTLDGYPLSEGTLKAWGKIVDLTQLESLKCSRGLPEASYFIYAPQVLKNLKHVSLNLSSRGEQIRDLAQTYISEIAPLESLSLWSWIGNISLDTILSRHGKTLRALQLHERETSADYDQERRKLLSDDDLNAIKEQCPSLRDLTFDVDRHSKRLNPRVELNHDANKWKTIASMGLDKLQIYYDLGVATMANSYGAEYESAEEGDPEVDLGGERPDRQDVSAQTNIDEDVVPASSPRTPPPKRQKKIKHPGFFAPSSNESVEPFVEELWKTIFGSRSNSTSRALDVKFGEWERKVGWGHMSRWMLEEGRMKTWWVVRPNERDDKPGECTVVKHGGDVESQ